MMTGGDWIAIATISLFGLGVVCLTIGVVVHYLTRHRDYRG